MKNFLLPRYELGTEQDFVLMAENERARQRSIAWQYLQSTPSILNMYNAASAFWNSLPFVGVSASDMNPYIQTGIAPSPGKLQLPTKLLGSERNWIDYANRLIKENKLQTTNAGGKTYVKTLDGKMRSLLNFGRDEYQLYLQRLSQMIKDEAAKGPVGNYQPYETYTPTRLSDTKGSINKVRGRLSNRNAYTANNIE